MDDRTRPGIPNGSPEIDPLQLALRDETRDRRSRPLRELRLSVIDRCNFRCTYCMPADSLQGQGKFLRLHQLLTDHELETLIGAFAQLGVDKLRITGGEPLVRPGLPALIGRLRKVPGIEHIALTTNGVLLPRLAADLAEAGLDRITVSLDTLDQGVLDTMSGGKAKLEDILAGIEAAGQAGFRRLKINTVVQGGVNDHTIMDLLGHFRGTGHTVRLIEFMDVGNVNHWDVSQVVPSATWVEEIGRRWPLQRVRSDSPSETARRYAYVDGQGEIGLISSITEPFCGGCTRARITADGVLYTCLVAERGTNLMPFLRQEPLQDGLVDRIRSIWLAREDHYSEERNARLGSGARREKVEMYRIGG
jgi:cyclic pyranopterin phosphate synthase